MKITVAGRGCGSSEVPAGPAVEVGERLLNSRQERA